MAHESMYIPRTGANGSSKSRIKVDTGSTGFYRGFEFRAYIPINLAAAGTLNIRFSSPINFILTTQRLQLVQGTLLARVFRGATFGGTWPGANIAPFTRNSMTEVAKYPDEISGTPYVNQCTITQVSSASGAPAGTIVGGTESDRIYVHTGQTQGNRSSSTVVGEGEIRGLPAGTYGITLGSIPGITNSDTAIGMYELIWEERPVSL